MAVNLEPPRAENLLTIAGVRLGVARAAIRKPNRKDLLLIALDESSRVAGVFPRTGSAAAPVIVCREHLAAKKPIRAVVVNTGVANAGTGEEGLLKARATCAAVAQLLELEAVRVLRLSTGVIMEPLPVDRIEAGLPDCVVDLAANHWDSAAEAIMTTDTVPKAVSRQTGIDGGTLSGTGISKRAVLAADRSFNAITVDGDTSTNDTLLLIASGRACNPEIVGEGTAEFGKLAAVVTEVAQLLAQAIVRDGEGATKFITITVDEGASHRECLRVCKSIANSPLVKTAFFASDPNLGRILAAVG